MDTRIGYPTEHLANSNTEAIKSPMYATGIGLVLKGFEAMDESNLEKEEPEVASSGDVTTHSETKRGSFFQSIIKKGVKFFDESDIEEEEHSSEKK